MSFFDDIEKEVIDDNILSDNVYNTLYPIISLDDVHNANDMMQYLFNISGLEDILKLIGNELNNDKINNVLTSFDFNTLKSSHTFTFNVFPYEHAFPSSGSARYTVIPNNPKDDIRLLIMLDDNNLHIKYYNYSNKTWVNMIYYMYNYYHISVEEKIRDIKELMLSKFDTYRVFKEKYVEL